MDLAGSEAVAKDGILGETKNEGIFINKGTYKLIIIINKAFFDLIFKFTALTVFRTTGIG